MLTTHKYNIVLGSNISTLSGESWKVFSPFVSRYQWGDDHPSHSPRKIEIANAILNRGRPGACTFQRDNGKYILPVLHPRHFEKAIKTRRKIYYVSYGSCALLYFDIDLHYAWQTLAQGQEAKENIDALLTDFLGQSVLFWSDSSRGFNGYLKVNLQCTDYAEANAMFGRLQQAMQLFLADQGNLADFEIKGRIGYLGENEYNWASYGKLPIHSKDWNLARLEEFKNTPTVPLRRLGVLCEAVEAGIPAEVLVQHNAHKKALGDAPIVEDDCFLVTPAIEKALLEKHGEAWEYMFAYGYGDKDGKRWLGLRYYRPGECPITEWELRDQAQVVQGEPIAPVPQVDGQPVLPAYMKGEPVVQGVPVPSELASDEPARKIPTKIALDLDDLRGEPDSMVRQHEALMRLARYLKRVPTEDEALEFIKAKSLFTGTWEENQGRRRTRVKSILAFIGRTFVASKCSTGSAVPVGKYDEWARKKFPNGLSGFSGGGMNEDGTAYRGKRVHVSWEFIAIFMAIMEHCLLNQRNEDFSLPGDWAEDLWNALYARGAVSVKFDERQWAVCRDMLDGYSIVDVFDRSYGPGRAIKWKPGVYFPLLGLWKTKKQPSLLGPGTLPEERERKEEEELNTWLRKQPARKSTLLDLTLSRPPPRAAPVFFS